jgi:23S rRNA (cytosine1962-C5)-methyltransferase
MILSFSTHPLLLKARRSLKKDFEVTANAMAMSVIEEGGLLATSSCSHHVDKTAFLDMLHLAAKDARKTVRVLELRSQARDHPVLLSMPETEYLKCAFLVISI